MAFRSDHLRFLDSNVYLWRAKEFHDSLASSHQFHPETEDVMFRVSEHVRKTHSQDGGIVLDIKQGRMYGLNLVGSKIIELIEREYTPTLIAQEIARTFGISPEIADTDVREFLETLEKHHLIETHASRVAL